MEREYLTRVGLLVVASTFVLTAAFLGVVQLASGNVTGTGNRVPYYALGGAIVFVATMVALEDPGAGGLSVLTATIGVSVLGFALLTLGGEGFVYAVRNPRSIVGSHLVVYFLAAGLVCTGTAYWSLHHWREFAE